MNVSRDVIVDLWPLYESGEASEDTRRLVEAFLEHDQELAIGLRDPSEDALRSDPLPPLKKSREIETLRKTKTLVRIRDILFCIAIFLSFTPLTVYEASWGSGWVIRDHPLLACGLVLAAVLAWFCYILLKRRLSTSGL